MLFEVSQILWKKFFYFGQTMGSHWRSKWQPIPVFLPGKSNGQRRLMDCSPWCHKALDTTEQLTHTHTQEAIIFFFNFYFIFKLYIIVLVLPNIKMNPPQVYMCSPSWTLLPPPSQYHPSGLSQCTSPLIKRTKYCILNLDQSWWLLHSFLSEEMCSLNEVFKKRKKNNNCSGQMRLTI